MCASQIRDFHMTRKSNTPPGYVDIPRERRTYGPGYMEAWVRWWKGEGSLCEVGPIEMAWRHKLDKTQVMHEITA